MLRTKAQGATGFWAIVVGAVLPLAALPLVPLLLYDQYFMHLLPVMGAKTVGHIYNQSITAVAVRLSLPIEAWFSFAPLDVSRWIRWLNATLLVVAVGAFVFSRIARFSDHLLLMLMVLAFMPLIAPLGWGHAYLFAIPLVAYCAVYGETPFTRLVAWLAWLLLLPPAYSLLGPVRQFGTPVVELLYSRYPIAVLGVICAALAGSHRANADAKGPLRQERVSVESSV